MNVNICDCRIAIYPGPGKKCQICTNQFEYDVDDDDGNFYDDVVENLPKKYNTTFLDGHIPI